MRALLWDLDDTLLNTLPSRMKALSHAYQTCLGEGTDPLALWRSHRGGTLEDLGKRLLGERDYRRFVDSYRDFYYSNHRSIEPFEGVEVVLAAYCDGGMPMAVVTSKIGYGATDELERAGLLRYFQAVVGFDDTDSHKPDPEPVFAAFERLLVDDPSEAVLIGDSPADMFAARNAGCRSIAAMWGTLDAELLLDASPDLVATHPMELRGLLAAPATGVQI